VRYGERKPGFGRVFFLLFPVSLELKTEINPPLFYFDSIKTKAKNGFPIQTLILKKVGFERYWINACAVK